MCPLIMKIDQLAQPVVSLGVMGCLCLMTGLLCHFLLPKTKGSTTETFEDVSEMTRFQSWSPRVQRKQTKTSETEEHREVVLQSGVIDEYSDDFSVRFLNKIKGSCEPNEILRFLEIK